MRQLLFRFFPTLHRRLLLIIAISIGACLLVLGFVSYEALRSIEQNRLQKSLVSELSFVADSIERGYMDLIQISEQMTPQGSIGRVMEAYFYAQSPYEIYKIIDALPDVVLPVTLGNYALLNFYYHSPEGEKIPFTYLMKNPSFDMQSLPVLSQGGMVRYHGVHKSSSYGLSSDVISISRPIALAGRPIDIYIEARSPISARSRENGLSLPYAILQLNEKDQIIYSSDSAFAPGRRLSIGGNLAEGDSIDGVRVGLFGSYYGAVLRSRAGFSTALLLPQSVYHREMNMWRLRVCLIISLCVAALFLVSLSLRRLIYRPMHALEQEMLRVGEGDLTGVDCHSGIAEFDRLFLRFGEMKRRLQESISEREQMHAQNHRLEMEKLLYQINPHFLMNTLNSVHWMAKMEGQGEIASFITDLVFILGYSLGKTEPVSTLRSELRYVQAYLNLLQKRYDFGVSIDVEEGPYLDAPTARMILQPISENAVQHGMDEKGTLRLCMFHDEARRQAVVIIEDDGRSLSVKEYLDAEKPFDGTPGEGKSPKGIGLRYVRMMLMQRYGSRAHMAIHRKSEKGTRVTLFLPLEDEEGRRDEARVDCG